MRAQCTLCAGSGPAISSGDPDLGLSIRCGAHGVKHLHGGRDHPRPFPPVSHIAASGPARRVTTNRACVIAAIPQARALRDWRCELLRPGGLQWRPALGRFARPGRTPPTPPREPPCCTGCRAWERMRAWTSSLAPSSGSAHACSGCGPGLEPVAEPTASDTAIMSAALGLGEAWEPVLHCLGADPSSLLPWRRRFVAATEPMTIADLRTIALRLQGHGPRGIAARAGRAAAASRHQIDRLCLAAAVRLAGDDAGPSWQLTRTGRTGRRLVHDGIPLYANTAIPQKDFDRLWLDGLSLEEIRAALVVGPKAARRLAQAAPPRWVGKDVAAYFGWSRENHRLRLAGGHFPPPDGRDGHSDWWWPTTVTKWATTEEFVRCPECDAQVLRLKQHMTKHTRPAN